MITDKLKEIDSALQGAGLKVSKEYFDFEYLPASISDKVYRFDLRGEGEQEAAGKTFDTISLDIYISYKIPASSKARAEDYYNRIDEIEALKQKLYKKFVGETFTLENYEIEDHGSYLVTKLNCGFENEVTYE